MSNSIHFGETIHQLILPYTIGNIVWMRFIQLFEDAGAIVHTPFRSMISLALKNEQLTSYIEHKFWDDFMNHPSIYKHKKSFDHFDPKDCIDFKNMVDVIQSRLYDKVTECFFEGNKNKDDVIFNEALTKHLFSEEEFQSIVIPFILEESVATVLCIHPHILKREEDVDAIDGVYTVDKALTICLSNPMGYAPIYLNQKIIADKNIMHIISFITSTIIVETKHCFKFTTSRTNQLKFFKI